MRFDFALGHGPGARRRGPADVRRLLLLADLRGSTAATTGLTDRPIRKVDVDTLDAVLAKSAPAVELGDAAGGERVEIRHFDDFHPDALVQRLSTFQRPRELRARLENPRTFAEAATELQRDAAAPIATASTPDVPAPGSDADTVDRLLGRTPAAREDWTSAPLSTTDGSTSRPDPTSPLVHGIDGIIRDAIAPHIVAAPDPQLPQLRAALDAAMTDLLRAVLHDPAFQSLEATWRSLQWLVSTLELGETLELYVLDVTRDDLGTGGSRDGDLWRRLAEGEWRAGGSRELSVIVGAYRFGSSSDDLATLARAGELAAALGVAFLAEALPELAGASSARGLADPATWAGTDSQTATPWTRFRTTEPANHVALALPRFMLRLPYGSRTDPITSFGFDEQPPTPVHDSFLWGNPALAYAVRVVRGLDADGDRSGLGVLDGFPAFVFATEEGASLQPPTEVVLSERALEAVQARGLLPIVGYRDRLDVRLLDPHPVAGRERA